MSIVEEQVSQEEVENPSVSSVMNKYKMAGEIANDVIKELMTKCVKGAKIYDLCQLGDKMIEEKTLKVFVKNKAVKKGIAFPTCVAKNEIICHYSPLKTESENVEITDGDVVKIELGVQIDGYPACVATTMVVGATKESPVTGAVANAMMAAYTALDLNTKLFQTGKTNHEVTEVINEVARDFHCLPIEGISSFNNTKGTLEGDKKILHDPNDSMKKDYARSEFEDWDVFCFDVFMTTGSDPKPKQKDTRSTVFRRNRFTYNLKMKNSRDLFKVVVTKYDEFAFSLASFDDEVRAKLGVKECVDHGLFTPYPVLYDKNDSPTVHFKFTAVITPNGPVKVVFPPFAQDKIKPDFKLTNPKLITLMNQPLSTKNKKTSQ